MKFLKKLGNAVVSFVKPIEEVITERPLEVLLGSHGFVQGTAATPVLAGLAVSPLAIASGLYMLTGEVKRIADVAETMGKEFLATRDQVLPKIERLVVAAEEINVSIGRIANSVDRIERSIGAIATSVADAAREIRDVSRSVDSLQNECREGFEKLTRLIIENNSTLAASMQRVVDQAMYRDAKSQGLAALADLDALQGAAHLSDQDLHDRLWDVQSRIQTHLTRLLDIAPFDTRLFLDASVLFLGWSVAYRALEERGQVGPFLEHSLAIRVRESVLGFLDAYDAMYGELQHRFSVLPAPDRCSDIVSSRPASVPYKTEYSALDPAFSSLLSPRSRLVQERILAHNGAKDGWSPPRTRLGSHASEGGRLETLFESGLTRERPLSLPEDVREAELLRLLADINLMSQRTGSYRVREGSLVLLTLALDDGRWVWKSKTETALASLGITDATIRAAKDIASLAVDLGPIRHALAATMSG